MKIVIAACPEIPVPPIKYGGTERQADIIARGLVAKGHDVLLLSGPGSTCPVTKIMTKAPTMSAEWEHISWLRSNKGWDCLLDMTAQHLPSQAIGLPDGSKTLALMLGDPHKKYAHDSVRNRVYCSKVFAEFNGCINHPVLPNIPTDCPQDVPLGDGSGKYCLYIGAIRPEKGVHLAASTCRRLGVPLKVAGPIQPRFAAYWNSFKDEIEYLGEIGGERWALMGNATCLMFPSLWCDAGPLVVKESLLCGTPVLACPNGGVIEDVDETNGMLVDPDDLNTGLFKMTHMSWDRRAIQEAAVAKANPIKHLFELETLLSRVVRGETW